jgi:PAS domain S-box-containing protein
MAVLGALLIIQFRQSRAVRQLRQSNQENIRVQTFALRSALADLLLADQAELAERRFLDALLDHRIQAMVLVDEHGMVRFASNRAWIGHPATRVPGYVQGLARQASDSNQPIYQAGSGDGLVGHLPVDFGFQEGTLREPRRGTLFLVLDFSLSQAMARRDLLVEALWILGYWFAVALVLYLLLEGWVTRKVDRMVHTIAAFEAGQLDARTHLDGRNELDRLGHSLDGLLDRLVQDQRDLRENREFLNTILEALPAMVFVKNAADLRFVSLNKAGEALLGIPREALIGKNDTDFFPAEQAEFFMAKDRAVLAGEGALDIPEEPIQTHAQGERILHTTKVPVRDELGQPRFLLGISQDITDRRVAEQALQASEARLRAIFDAEPECVKVMSPEGILLQMNAAGLAILEVDAPEEAIGRPLLAAVCPEYHQTFQDIAQKALLGELAAGEFEMQGKKGTRRWMETRVVPLRDESGRATALLAVTRDITERKRAEAERQQLEQQMAQIQKLESLGSLASGVAHDMNNVLSAILSLASVHAQQAPEGSALHQSLDTISKACLRGGTLVKGLLGFARQGLAEERILDLNALVREEVALLERTTLAQVQLVMELADELRPMKGDPAALTHALMNLCVNAVDAMEGHGTLTIRTRNEGPETLVLEIADTGSGMTPQVLERAMDPFFSTKPQGKGTGLGLSMVYGTVKAHGGEVSLQSTPGAGTTVTLRLPACAPGPGALEATHPATEVPRPLRVLLVDDDELIQASTAQLLELLGHHPTVTSRAEEALAMLEQGLPVDVMILDLNMPGLGGAAALPRVRALRPELTVLLATGRADQKAMDLVHSLSKVILLAKPFSLVDLQVQLKAIALSPG